MSQKSVCSRCKQLEYERETFLVQVGDQAERIVQLENELAEYQDKPEAFERLRKLLRKERQMRKQDGKRLESKVGI